MLKVVCVCGIIIALLYIRCECYISCVYIFAFACLSCNSLSLDYSDIGGLITPVGSFILHNVMLVALPCIPGFEFAALVHL